MTEACYRDKTKHYLHPIIDWSTTDVWEYIRSRGIRYCSLYDEGFKRIGCVLCPMTRDIERQLARWPKLCNAWEKAVKATYVECDTFATPEAYWQWWLDRDRPAKQYNDNQVMMFED